MPRKEDQSEVVSENQAAPAEEVQTSEEAMIQSILHLTDAGAPIIQVRTREPNRAMAALRRYFVPQNEEFVYTEWDCVNGRRVFDAAPDSAINYTRLERAGEEADMPFYGHLQHPLECLRNSSHEINETASADGRARLNLFVYLNATPFLRDHPAAIELLSQYAALLPAKPVVVIMVTADESLPVPQGTVQVVHLGSPREAELRAVLESIHNNNVQENVVDDLTEDGVRQICAMGQGMTLSDFETALSKGFVQATRSSDGDDTPPVTVEDYLVALREGKTEAVKQSDILELFPADDMNNVGGLHKLRGWLEDRRSAFSPEARAFGIVPPKGVFVVGVPGTGKSLLAKAAAGTLGVPLIRFDFGRIFSKYIGDSESRVRQALSMVEDMGRLVLFVDEVDKGLGGIGSGGDSGVSSRVLGTFLTWMQETKSEAFIIMTANSVTNLPPELTRKGRMDEIFFTGLPTPTERREVLNVHLRRRGHSADDWTDVEWREIVTASDSFVPAEIEQVVKDALILSWKQRGQDAPELKASHVKRAFETAIPMARAHKSKIDAIVNWGVANAVSASYSEAEEAVAAAKRAGRPVAQATMTAPRRRVASPRR